MNKNITDAMIQFQQTTRSEEDYNAVARGLWYLTMSIYRRTPNWKKVMRQHLEELLDELPDENL